MPHPTNPFVQGHLTYRIERQLLITYENDCPPCYRVLHESQVHLRDDEIECFPCIFDDDVALITEGQEIAEDVLNPCMSNGIVRSVIHSVFGGVGDQHIADTHSPEMAQRLVEQLKLSSEHCSRSWEVSTAHLPCEALLYIRRLFGLAYHTRPTGCFVEFFPLPDRDAVGCQLFHTPWYNQNLEVLDLTAGELRQEQLAMGIPEALVDVLHLAAEAEARFLVFDPFASVLEGLPVFTD